MNEDPEVMEFFLKILSPEESKTLYNKITVFFEKNNYGLFAIESKLTQQFAGFIGFSQPTFTSYFTPCIEIGWRLGRQFWNQGFATEGATVCLKYEFFTLGFKDIYSWTSKINTKSIRITEKIVLTTKLNSSSRMYRQIISYDLTSFIEYLITNRGMI